MNVHVSNRFRERIEAAVAVAAVAPYTQRFIAVCWHTETRADSVVAPLAVVWVTFVAL